MDGQCSLAHEKSLTVGNVGVGECRVDDICLDFSAALEGRKLAGPFRVLDL